LDIGARFEKDLNGSGYFERTVGVETNETFGDGEI